MFKFRLARVHRVRELVEDKRQQEWAVCHQRLVAEKLSLQALETERKSVIQFGYEQPDIPLRTAMYRFLVVLDKRIEQQIAVVMQWEETTEQAKQLWLTARREREILDKLKEKKFHQYCQESARAEQKILDDLANRARP